MLDNEKLLFDELYEKTKDCGRIQFVELLMTKERENKELKLQLKGTTHCFDEEEHEKLKKQVEEYEKELKTWKKKYPNRAEKIKQYDINGNFIKEHNSSREAGKLLNISEKTISSCVNGHSKTAGGFIWKR